MPPTKDPRRHTLTATRTLRLCVLLLFLTLPNALAKSYWLAEVIQEVTFRANGTVLVKDTRTLQLDGDFSDNTYFVNIDPAPGGSVRFTRLEALDGKAPAVAEINGNEIAWQVRGADEARTFRFYYLLTNEVAVAADAARFNRQVLEPAHARVDSYTLRVRLPGSSPELFKMFVFTGEDHLGKLSFDEGLGEATVTLPGLAEDEAFRVDLLLGAGLFDARTVEEPRLEIWLGEIGDQVVTFRGPSWLAQQQEQARARQEAEAEAPLTTARDAVAGLLSEHRIGTTLTLERLFANPFVYEGRNVALTLSFERMVTADRAVFEEANAFDTIAIDNVPTTTFTEPGTRVVVAVKVVGVKDGEVVVKYLGSSPCWGYACADLLPNAATP